MIQSPDSLETVPNMQAMMDQFEKHVETLEEQYIDEEIDVTQQPEPFIENSRDASGAVYRHS